VQSASHEPLLCAGALVAIGSLPSTAAIYHGQRLLERKMLEPPDLAIIIASVPAQTAVSDALFRARDGQSRIQA
jgi:hypothetical protein